MNSEQIKSIIKTLMNDFDKAVVALPLQDIFHVECLTQSGRALKHHVMAKELPPADSITSNLETCLDHFKQCPASSWSGFVSQLLWRAVHVFMQLAGVAHAQLALEMNHPDYMNIPQQDIDQTLPRKVGMLAGAITTLREMAERPDKFKDDNPPNFAIFSMIKDQVITANSNYMNALVRQFNAPDSWVGISIEIQLEGFRRIETEARTEVPEFYRPQELMS